MTSTSQPSSVFKTLMTKQPTSGMWLQSQLARLSWRALVMTIPSYRKNLIARHIKPKVKCYSAKQQCKLLN